MTYTGPEQMYFGTRERMVFVAAPAPGAGFAAKGYSERLDYYNGGVGLRNSTGSHQEYDMSWGSLTRDQIEDIEDYAYNLYGDGLIHFLDPYAMDRNLFNRQWSSPKITAEDGIPLAGTTRPVKVLLGDGGLGYPFSAAQYTITTGMPALKFHCPIPPNYVAWVGCHGSANARGLTVQPTLNGVNTGGSVAVATTSVVTTTRFTNSFANSGSVNGIDISLDTTANWTATLAGLMLQVLPTGVTPNAGVFISGRGHSGCVFEGKLNAMPYSLPGESIGLTAKLIEVGDWQ